MFKAYDIRAKECNLTPEMKERLIDSLVVYCRQSLKVEKVIIGRDARKYVPLLADMAVEKLVAAGIDVIVNSSPISTCQFYYMCISHPDCAGLMFTASHNPAEYVGIKIMAPHLVAVATGTGPDGGIVQIKKNYEENKKPDCLVNKGAVTETDQMNEYIDYCMKLAGVGENDLKGLKVLMEFLCGSAGREMIAAFKKAGADVSPRNEIPNGDFPCGDPNPIIESSIAPAREAMKEGNYDIGFCFDGDGDRMDVMDTNGQQIMPAMNFSAVVPYLKEIYKGLISDVYTDVKAAPTAMVRIAQTGLGVHTIRNGHSFIKTKLRENCKNGYFAAVEESAHYYINLPFDINDFSKGFAAGESTLFYALLTAKTLKNHPEYYAQIQNLQKTLFREREWAVHCENNPKLLETITLDVSDKLQKMGAVLVQKMDDNSDLDGQLLRFNLPLKIDANSNLEGVEWVQVAQRISRSEDSVCRWEVVSNSEKACKNTAQTIKSIAATYLENM